MNKRGTVAISLADTAADILKELGNDHLYFYCAAINNKGMAYLSVYEPAEHYCQDILKKYQKINKNKWDHLYALYTLLGDIYRGLGQKKEAESAYQMAMNLVEEASGQNFEYKNIKEKLEMLDK